jgi:hypothetical protein
MSTATATPTATTDELNGLLEKQTPSLISVGIIAKQLKAESEAILDFCKTKGYFVAPLYDGGEYMIDFNAITPDFIRDFTYATMAKSLEPKVQEGVEAIASLRNTATTTETPAADTPITTEATEVEEAPDIQPTSQAETTSSGWKLGKKGKGQEETINNLISANDPDGSRNFIQALRKRTQGTGDLMERLAQTYYKGGDKTLANLWKVTDSILAKIAAAAETENPKNTKRHRRGNQVDQPAAS